MKVLSIGALALGIGACGVMIALAQPPGGPPGGHGRPDDRGMDPVRFLPPPLRDDLKLTPEQDKQVDALEAELRDKLMKILTPEQQKQLKEFRRGGPGGPSGRGPGRPGEGRPPQEGRPGGERGGPPPGGPGDQRPPPPPGAGPGDQPPPPPPGPGGLERALEDLKLTDKQRAKADEVLKAHHEAVRKFFEQSRTDLLKQMKDVLSEEQYRQFEKTLPAEPAPPPPPPPPPGDRPPPPRDE
jgi:Spy/CpxP family protein refolding chaperone